MDDQLRNRAAYHISLFTRIRVQAKEKQPFFVTARKTSTVFELLGLIEAEHAFQNNLDSLASGMDNLLTDRPTIPPVSPLVCMGLLHNGRELRQDDLVGEVLPTDATVEVISDPPLPELRHLLHSRAFISHFIPYCKKENSLPPVLFWLEVELAKGKHRAPIIQYIENTFILTNAPLRLRLFGSLKEQQSQVYRTTIHRLMLQFIDSPQFDSYCEERLKGGDLAAIADYFRRDHDLVAGTLKGLSRTQLMDTICAQFLPPASAVQSSSKTNAFPRSCNEKTSPQPTLIERKLLLKRIRKLKVMLGENFTSEHIISPALTETSSSASEEEDWPCTPTPLQQFKKLCNVLGGPDGLYSLSGEAPIQHIVPRLARRRSSTNPTTHNFKTKAQVVRSMDKLQDILGERPPQHIAAPISTSPPTPSHHTPAHQKRILKLRKLLGQNVEFPSPPTLNKSLSATDLTKFVSLDSSAS